MNSTLFLYLDILGFRELVADGSKIDWLYEVIDASRIHRDSNYRTIVFSDTLLAYNTKTYTDHYKAIELMYLIELVQEFAKRLTGSGIAFRGIITEGNFIHRKMQNIDAYYGDALIRAYDAEKGLIGTGLYLDSSLTKFNKVFDSRKFSEKYDFIYLLQHLSRLDIFDDDHDQNGRIQRIEGPYPLPGTYLDDVGLHYDFYCEVRQLQEIHNAMISHPAPAVRAKYLATWSMWELQLPRTMRALVDGGFYPGSLVACDWESTIRHFEEVHSQDAIWQPENE